MPSRKPAMLKSDGVELRRRKLWVGASPGSEDRTEIIEVGRRRNGDAPSKVMERRREWPVGGKEAEASAEAEGDM